MKQIVKNGVNLPEEWMLVLIYDPEDSKVGYFVGRFYQAFDLCCSTRFGWDYSSIGHLKWQEIDYYREEE